MCIALYATNSTYPAGITQHTERNSRCSSSPFFFLFQNLFHDKLKKMTNKWGNKMEKRRKKQEGTVSSLVSILFAGLLKILPFFAQDKFRFKIEGMKKMGHEGLTVAHGKTETKGGNTCSSVTAAFLIVFFFLVLNIQKSLPQVLINRLRTLEKKACFHF